MKLAVLLFPLCACGEKNSTEETNNQESVQEEVLTTTQDKDVSLDEQKTNEDFVRIIFVSENDGVSRIWEYSWNGEYLRGFRDKLEEWWIKSRTQKQHHQQIHQSQTMINTKIKRLEMSETSMDKKKNRG